VITIRRIYAYLLAFAGLSMLALAVVNLGQLGVDLWLGTPSAEHVRDTLAFNIAAALVGLPVWLLHWGWTERWARDSLAERASTLRRLYVYAVLISATWALAYAAHEAIAAAVFPFSTPNTPARVKLNASLDEAPVIVVAALVWAMHWRVAARDRRLVGEQGGSATLRRWYLYATAFVGFVLLLTGASGLLEAAWRGLTAASGPFGLPEALASTLVGLGVWVVHWRVLPGQLGEDAEHDDGVSVLRSVYLFLALSVAVAGTLIGLSQLLYYAVARLLGVADPGGVGGNLLQAAAEPASAAIVYGLAWTYQRYALRRQATAFDEAPRQAGVRRLYTSVVALISLAILAVGAAGLLWTAGDVLLNAAAATSGEGWRGNVALFATLLGVGLPVWLVHWQPSPGSDDDVRSLSRRLYVYLALIGAMLSLVGSAAAALYRVISLLLGASSGASVLTDLTRALAVAVVAAGVAAYHWRILRADARRTAEAQALVPEPVQPLEPREPLDAPPSTEAHVTLHVRAASPAALEQAIAALRASGVDVAVLP
jgi:hypothetical protein